MLARSFLFAALAGSALADLTVNTISSLIECQPALISWNGGTAPYFLAAIPGGNPSAAALENFPQQTGTSFTWKVDLAAGTSVTIKITDSTGETNYNQMVTIQSGSDTSCIGSGSGNSTSNAGGDSAAAPSGSAAPAAGAAGQSSAAGAGSAPSASSAATQANVAAGSGASGASQSATSASKAASTPASASASGSAAASTSGAAFPQSITDRTTGVVAVLGAVAALFL